ncbi:MAG: STAS domain-containing protein [Oscillospiraceae bacterium]|nr:STAS domain-containing protein [Oscillospiraceae bacterium]
MEIKKTAEGTRLTVALEGRLDTLSSRDLEKELRATVPGLTELVFDFEKLTFITSAGLRVISLAKKLMNKQGHMVIRNTQSDVMEVFDATGLSAFLEFE